MESLNIVSLELLSSSEPPGTPNNTWSHARFLTEILPSLAAQTPVRNGSKSALLLELQNPEFVSRNSTHAHLTTSCIVVHPNATHVLLLHHRKIQEWVYPGGHADGDWYLLRSALRECTEETGLRQVRLLPAFPQQPLLPFFVQHFFLKPFGDTPAHEHYDAVFAFQALTSEVVFDEAESAGIRWVPVEQLKAQVQQDLEMQDGISFLTADVCLSVLHQAECKPHAEGNALQADR